MKFLIAVGHKKIIYAESCDILLFCQGESCFQAVECTERIRSVDVSVGFPELRYLNVSHHFPELIVPWE